MKKYKILFADNVLQALVNFRGGVINELLNQDIEVILLAPHDSRNIPDLDARIKWIPIVLKRHGKNIFYDVKYFFKLLQIYRKEKPDFIFHYTIKPNIYGTIASYFLRIPSALMITGLGYAYSSDSLQARLARFLYRLSCFLTNQIIVLNKKNKEFILNQKIASKEKILWLEGGEGVNIRHYKSDLSYDKIKDTIDFLFIGRLIKEKGVFEFIEAASKIKDKYRCCNFHIVGDFDFSHPESIKPEELATFEGRNIITYHGVANDIRPFVQSSDCIVLPSYYSEGLSRSLMEALSMSKPIITTNNAGCEETVQDKMNGYIIEKKNEQSLVAGIQMFVELNHEERRMMGLRSRELAVRVFDEELVKEAYKNIISRFTAIEFDNDANN